MATGTGDPGDEEGCVRKSRTGQPNGIEREGKKGQGDVQFASFLHGDHNSGDHTVVQQQGGALELSARALGGGRGGGVWRRE
jgi:hypothetical protein